MPPRRFQTEPNAIATSWRAAAAERAAGLTVWKIRTRRKSGHPEATAPYTEDNSSNNYSFCFYSDQFSRLLSVGRKIQKRYVGT